MPTKCSSRRSSSCGRRSADSACKNSRSSTRCRCGSGYAAGDFVNAAASAGGAPAKPAQAAGAKCKSSRSSADCRLGSSDAADAVIHMRLHKQQAQGRLCRSSRSSIECKRGSWGSGYAADTFIHVAAEAAGAERNWLGCCTSVGLKYDARTNTNLGNIPSTDLTCTLTLCSPWCSCACLDKCTQPERRQLACFVPLSPVCSQDLIP
eukprot:1156892-Pelagomonas_calceolata.AAC.13